MTWQYPVICLQHLLPSVHILLRQVKTAFEDCDLVLAGKPYSTIDNTVAEIAAEGYALPFNSWTDIPCDQIRSPALILDEGGRLHDRFTGFVERNVAGVEQTTSGLRSAWKYPTILVCRSAAKLVFESQIIARGILRKLDSLGVLAGRQIGVIGAGAIGSELAIRLIERGHRVAIFDIVPPRGILAAHFQPIADLLSSSALILGATGRDCLEGVSLQNLATAPIFASCSSSDVEFASLSRFLDASRQFDDLKGNIGQSMVTLLNGGFPINFDRKTEWETAEEISLTRQLCFHGLLQASQMVALEPEGIMLDPAVQARLVTDWLDRVPDREGLRLPPDLDERFFQMRSEGKFTMSGKPDYQLHSTTPAALDRMRSHSKPYETVVGGISIVVLPNVWSPQYDWSSAFYIENFPDVRDRSFLEIGSGTGILSVYAGIQGARKVVAGDANPNAVENTRQNFARHNLRSTEAVLSEAFDHIRGRFDVIAWNAPYHGSRPSDVLERGAADEDYRGIRAFFRDAGDHLEPEGIIVFGFSESGDLPLIRSLFAANNYRVQREFSDWRQDYNCMLFVLVRADEQDIDR